MTKHTLTLFEALNEIDELDVGQCKKSRIEAHVRFCRKYNFPYNLKKLSLMPRNDIKKLKYAYSKRQLQGGKLHPDR